MEKQQFIDNFKLLLVQINSLTSEYCFNELSNNYKFIIEPSQQEISNHLSEFENGFVKKWKTLQGKQLTFDEVVDLFHQHNKTPKWVDCSVYYSTSEITIVHLFFSRKFRDESEIYYLEWGTGPFKALVTLPPDHRKVMHGDKFDVNWKWNNNI